MSGRSSWNVRSLAALLLLCAACAPGTDEAPGHSQGSAGTLNTAGSPPLAAAGTIAPPLAGTGAGVTVGAYAGSGVGIAGSAATGTLGSAGRSPITGLPVAGTSGFAGISGSAGRGAAGSVAIAGTGGGTAGTTGAAGAAGSGTGGPCGSGTPTDGRPTTGALACIVEQHNATRAMVKTTPALPPVTWSAALATYAQQWTDQTCTSPMHRSSPMMNGKPLGENLYASSGFGDTMAGKAAVDGWSGEVACYTYGKFMTADKCDMTCTDNMHSDGCGHYTQVVWRTSVQIGCGVTTCGSGFNMQTEVICNYAPAGNFIGELPY
jgi:pathogenesis-related protein 1